MLKAIGMLLLVIMLVLGMISFFGALVLENFFNTNIMPVSAIAYGMHVASFLGAFSLFIFAIIFVVDSIKKKEKPLEFLLLSLGSLVFMGINIVYPIDLVYLMNGGIQDYKGYASIYHTIDERLVSDYSYPVSSSVREKYVKERILVLDNGETLHYRKNRKEFFDNGACEVRYMPFSKYLLRLKEVDKSFLKEQEKKLSEVSEKIDMQAEYIDIKNESNGKVYHSKCKAEITEVIKKEHMEKFTEYTSQPKDSITGNECAVKVKLTFTGFSSDDSDNRLCRFLPVYLEAEFAKLEGSEYKSFFGHTNGNFNGGFMREYTNLDASIDMTEESVFVAEGWLEAGLYVPSEKDFESPIYLALHGGSVDINEQPMVLEVGQYLKPNSDTLQK
jgi:hypothetical protein